MGITIVAKIFSLTYARLGLVPVFSKMKPVFSKMEPVFINALKIPCGMADICRYSYRNHAWENC